MYAKETVGFGMLKAKVSTLLYHTFLGPTTVSVPRVHALLCPFLEFSDPPSPWDGLKGSGGRLGLIGYSVWGREPV